MLFDLILVIIIVSYLKKILSPSELTPEWKRIFTYAIALSVALFLSESMAKNINWLFEWLGHALVWSLAWFIFTKKEWRKARPFLFAFLPLLAITTITDIVKVVANSFYNKWENYFDTAALFAVVWLVAMVIIYNKQRKALEKERIKVEEKEKEIKLTEKLKATLEVQVQERTAELVKQKEELQHALDELKAAQTQLIHSEKMASLGELTAGIAHEIQNPLNFVNNFSEVSRELIDELKSQKTKLKSEEQDELLSDIDANLEKILHHGKRADAIVKGMLQHSRSSTGTKEPTDINDLCDEYVRLSYHGLRAKDKSFQGHFETDFDTSLPKINVIPQDIGRVILNLINNAFYAAAQPFKEGLSNSDVRKVPTVWVRTRKNGNKVLISVKDNGPGIPDSIKEKIFQPFFTTKPTGQGTGLGLSLSYDIVKAHGGEIKVNTKENEGTEFIINLPV
ncbi:MAG TPA: ATP-binding protein [Chitinophagaceae bacterium]|jgi:signal transduction histidine kinase|nr:ATP-binding protein [Chitinophagaceae bacterium]